MGRTFVQTIKRFDGGIADDPRQPLSNLAAMVKHFDIFSNPYKMSPYRSTEADTNDGSSSTGMKQYDVRHFTLGTNGKLYGLGKNGSSQPKVVSKATPASGNWTLEATAEGNAARIVGAFIEWQNAWWFFEGTNKLSKWTIGSTVTDGVLTVGSTILTVAQGVIGADDNLYMFYNNKVVRVNAAGTATDDVFAGIPSDMRITSVTRYGTYIAIGCAYGTSATATPLGRSQVFLWDMVNTVTAFDIVDWGEGALMCLGNVEGRLCGVTDNGLSSSLGLSKGSMVVRMWAGGTPQVMKEIVANQTVTLGRFLNEVVVKNNKMYWVASVPFNQSTTTESTFHLGVWVFGRKNANSDFTLALDQIEEAIDTSNYKIVSFGNAGNLWYINHSNDGSITKTDDSANYTYTSIYESPILDLEDSSLTKKLLGVTVRFASLPAAGQVVLKYRKDEEASYTTIFTHTTDDSISHASVNIESSGATLPQFKEIQFRIESTGNAEITGLKFKAEVVSKDLYDDN